MTADDNPYRTPETTVHVPSPEYTALRRVCRVALLAVVGFITFYSMGSALIWVFDSEPLAVQLGVLGAILFAVSDSLYRGPRAGDTVLRRVGVTIGVFVATGIVSKVIANVLGWDLFVPRGNPARIPPHQNHMIVTQCVVFVLLQFAARRWWARSPAAQGTNAVSPDTSS